MIDSVRLSTELFIPNTLFDWDIWRRHTYEDGRENYFVHQNKVWLRYYPDTCHLIVDGKLLTLLYDTDVLNVDDCYGNDLDAFLTDINDCLNQLFIQPVLDIRFFRATRLDYCFNVITPYVTTYIDLLNRTFRMTNNGNRVNYVLEKRLNGSVYIKTKRDYQHNERRNYVLNYYDKSDWLFRQRKSNRVTHQMDEVFAKDVLRLEVQCGYQFIKQICEKHSMPNRFDLLLSYEIALWAEETIYNRIFRNSSELDFFTYEEAKKLLCSDSAKKTLMASACGKRIIASDYDYGRRNICNAGIFPFVFLQKRGDVKTLVNPIKLLRKKIGLVA